MMRRSLARSVSMSRCCSRWSSLSARGWRRSPACSPGRCSASIPAADFEVLIFAFVVVVVGGLGSLRGALAGALLVGILDDFGKAFFPQFALFTVFVPMAVMLVMRPTGLFGRQ